MNNFRKIAALLMALVMVLATAAAFGTEADLTNGEVGGFATAHRDDPQTQAKTINLKKEITVFNPTEGKVYGPAITYEYTIGPAESTELGTITDQGDDHTSGNATTASVKVGEGEPTITNVEWTNNDVLNASPTGTANTQDISIDFSDVVFGSNGVYRYKITESATYNNTGVTDGTITATRYLDVYVIGTKDGDNKYTDGETAAQWTIYGYVCMATANSTVNNDTAKTNGFVAAGGETADQYHTYNLTVGKTLAGDPTMGSHEFPFAVGFTTSVTYYKLAAKKSGTATIAMAEAVNGLAALTVTDTRADGSPTIANGSSVTLVTPVLS